MSVTVSCHHGEQSHEKPSGVEPCLPVPCPQESSLGTSRGIERI